MVYFLQISTLLNISFLIPIVLSDLTIKIVRLFRYFGWSMDIGLIISELFLYFLIYVVSVLVRDKVIPFIQSRKKEKVTVGCLLIALCRVRVI